MNKKILIIIGCIMAIIVIILLVINIRNHKKFKLDSIYDVLPKEVRLLYANTVNVSCGGDLVLDIKIDGVKLILMK